MNPYKRGAKKLDAEKVTEIRLRYANDETATTMALGREFEVCNQRISAIVRGFAWKTAPGPIFTESCRPLAGRRRANGR